MSENLKIVLFRFIYTLVLVVSSLSVNLIQIFLYIFLKRFNKKLFYKILNATSDSVLFGECEEIFYVYEL